jgi:hypothetical protein
MADVSFTIPGNTTPIKFVDVDYIAIDGEVVWRRPALKVGDVVRIESGEGLAQDGKLGTIVEVLGLELYRVSFGTESTFHVSHLQGEV